MLKKAKMIKNLSIRITGNTMSEKIIEEVLRPLSTCTKLKAIHLNFSNNTNMTDRCLPLIIKYIKKIVSLESLDLNFSRNTKLTENGIAAFFTKLYEVRYLKSISLNLTNITLPGRVINSLAETLRGFKELTDFGLFMRNSNLRGVFGFPLFKAFANLPKIQAITLDFPFIFDGEDDCPMAQSLTSLTLKLFNSAVGPTHLTHAFSKLKALKNLSCDFSQNSLNIKTFKQIFEGISKMESLETLDLKLTGNKIENADLSVLSNMKQLRCFKLSCGK